VLKLTHTCVKIDTPNRSGVLIFVQASPLLYSFISYYFFKYVPTQYSSQYGIKRIMTNQAFGVCDPRLSQAIQSSPIKTHHSLIGSDCGRGNCSIGRENFHMTRFSN
jgi:hypothetical protein